jgi:hypothetical protein
MREATGSGRGHVRNSDQRPNPLNVPYSLSEQIVNAQNREVALIVPVAVKDRHGTKSKTHKG